MPFATVEPKIVNNKRSSIENIIFYCLGIMAWAIKRYEKRRHSENGKLDKQKPLPLVKYTPKLSYPIKFSYEYILTII